jgi:hypothetical protein
MNPSQGYGDWVKRVKANLRSAVDGDGDKTFLQKSLGYSFHLDKTLPPGTCKFDHLEKHITICLGYSSNQVEHFREDWHTVRLPSSGDDTDDSHTRFRPTTDATSRVAVPSVIERFEPILASQGPGFPKQDFLEFLSGISMGCLKNLYRSYDEESAVKFAYSPVVSHFTSASGRGPVLLPSAEVNFDLIGRSRAPSDYFIPEDLVTFEGGNAARSSIPTAAPPRVANLRHTVVQSSDSRNVIVSLPSQPSQQQVPLTFPSATSQPVVPVAEAIPDIALLVERTPSLNTAATSSTNKRKQITSHCVPDQVITFPLLVTADGEDVGYISTRIALSIDYKRDLRTATDIQVAHKQSLSELRKAYSLDGCMHQLLIAGSHFL